MSHEEDSELPGCSVVAFAALIGAALWIWAFFSLTGV